MAPRCRTVTAAVAAVAAVASAWLLVGCRSQPPTDAAPTYDGTLRARILQAPGAISVSATLTADRALGIASGSLLMDGRRMRVMFAPRDGRDPDGPEDYGPLRVAAGVRVDLGSGGLPDCAAHRPSPLVVDLTLAGAGDRHRRYLLDDGGTYATAARRVCATGVSADVTGSRQNVDGSFAVTLSLTNPGPGPATVTSAAYDVGTTHWTRSSVVLPARSPGRLVVRGRGADQLAGCTHDTPWAAGRLTADGRPVAIPRSEDPC